MKSENTDPITGKEYLQLKAGVWLTYIFEKESAFKFTKGKAYKVEHGNISTMGSCYTGFYTTSDDGLPIEVFKDDWNIWRPSTEVEFVDAIFQIETPKNPEIQHLQKQIDYLVKELGFYQACYEAQGFISKSHSDNQKIIKHCEDSVRRDLEEYLKK